jgi:hypothetical protein
VLKKSFWLEALKSAARFSSCGDQRSGTIERGELDVDGSEMIGIESRLHARVIESGAHRIREQRGDAPRPQVPFMWRKSL